MKVDIIRNEKLIREGTLQDWVNGRLPNKRPSKLERFFKLLGKRLSGDERRDKQRRD